MKVVQVIINRFQDQRFDFSHLGLKDRLAICWAILVGKSWICPGELKQSPMVIVSSQLENGTTINHLEPFDAEIFKKINQDA